MQHENKKNRYSTGVLVLLTMLITSALIYSDAALNKADLFDPQVTGTVDNSVYMPSYTADIGEEGLIEIKTKQGMKPFDAVSFVMTYNPSTYLSFPSNPLIFDNSTLFKNVVSQSAKIIEPGTMEVTIVLQNTLTVDGVTTSNPATHPTLFKIRTQVSANTPNNTDIIFGFKGMILSNGNEDNEITVPSSFISVSNKQVVDDFKNIKVTSLVPSSIATDKEATLVFSGTDLNLVNQVWIGKKAQTITNKTNTTLTVKISANSLLPDGYQITFYDQFENSLNISNQLTVTEAGKEEEQVQEELKEAPPQTPLGDSPKVVADKSYTTPAVTTNDGKTPFSLYVLVEDKNNDVKTVIADLRKIGQVGTETPDTFGKNNNLSIPTSCPTNSNFIVCMQPNIKQGDIGQWYVLPNVTVSKSVAASNTPYQVEVTVTDEKGNKDKKAVAVYVSDGTTSGVKAVAAVATSKTSIEVMFDKPVSVSTTGSGFTINSSANVSDTLKVTHASLNAAKNVAILTTADQVADKKYVVNVSSDVKDLEGKAASNNSVSFDGFKPLNSPPVLDYVTATYTNKVELEFKRNLKLSTLSSAKMKIYESENTLQNLKIIGYTMISGNKMIVETDPQIPERGYRINLEGLQSYDGTPSPAAINKGFKGFNLKFLELANIVRQADFNQDGRVDFADFTIFSSVYGFVYFGDGENLSQAVLNNQQIGQPLSPNPDSLVPHTSEPNGGQL